MREARGVLLIRSCQYYKDSQLQPGHCSSHTDCHSGTRQLLTWDIKVVREGRGEGQGKWRKALSYCCYDLIMQLRLTGWLTDWSLRLSTSQLQVIKPGQERRGEEGRDWQGNMNISLEGSGGQEGHWLENHLLSSIIVIILAWRAATPADRDLYPTTKLETNYANQGAQTSVEKFQICFLYFSFPPRSQLCRDQRVSIKVRGKRKRSNMKYCWTPTNNWIGCTLFGQLTNMTDQLERLSQGSLDPLPGEEQILSFSSHHQNF